MIECWNNHVARVAELAYAYDSKSYVLTDLWVQLPPRAPRWKSQRVLVRLPAGRQGKTCGFDKLTILLDLNMKHKTLRHMLSFPFIWMMIVPIIFTDILLEIYHRICFPLYGIPMVKRSRYIRITDRGKLPYLSTLEKIHCLYCGYVNG